MRRGWPGRPGPGGRGVSGSVINSVISAPPRAGHRISFIRLDGISHVPLTDLHADAERLATGLSGLGVGRGDRIGILASNCLEWVLLDLAALRLGAVTAGFEPGKFDPGTELINRYRLAMLFTDRGADQGGQGIRPISDVTALIDSSNLTPPLPPVRYRPDDVTTIKFTSGSTGEPKGLAATVGSIDSSISAVQAMFGHGSGDDLFVFLPLSLLQQRYWIYSALRYDHDVTVSTYEAAFAALRGAEPTVVMGVPAFYETAKKQIERMARREPPGLTPDEALSAAARKVFGSRIRYLWTGSAPARPSMLRFFTSVGMPIYEGYGLNETCIVSKNHPGAHREGSVGQVLPGKKVLLEADGLVSIHSEHPVSWRYEYAAAGESERVFAADGTVRTGDLGYIDDDGFLFIRGRADDVIVLDNGKKIIVRPIEEYLKASPAIEECVVLCPAQTYLVAVVSAAQTRADTGAIAARLAAANATFSRDEQISDVIVASEPFSIENGMLTSQFKPRRQRILAAYAGQVTAVKRNGNSSNANQANQHRSEEVPGDGI
jgi:long-subunit acyl-CoA synthetase (AMP-forming)